MAQWNSTFPPELAASKHRAAQLTFRDVLQKGVTWLKETLSSCIGTNADAVDRSKNLVVPITVTTRWESLDLKYTETGKAQSTYLPMHLLTCDQTQAVRLISTLVQQNPPMPLLTCIQTQPVHTVIA